MPNRDDMFIKESAKLSFMLKTGKISEREYEAAKQKNSGVAPSQRGVFILAAILIGLILATLIGTGVVVFG